MTPIIGLENLATKTMNKTIRILFIAFGIVGPVLIGGLHTWTHFTQLVTPEIQNHLSGELLINGEIQTYWHTWGIVSFMMGIAMVALGLVNAAFLLGRTKPNQPPLAAILVMMGFLAGVVYAGFAFEQAPQLIAGIVGLVAMTTCLFLRLRMLQNQQSNGE